MLFSAQKISYQQTNAFTKIPLAYTSGADALKPFYSFEPTIDGIIEAIEQKKTQNVNRKLLVSELERQYQSIEATEAVKSNIQSLLSEDTFTVCTAHQPNLFTGPVYFIYKILHAIKLSAALKDQLPEYNFVPVYYMGSEDADFAELNHTYVNGYKLEWKKAQTGAVGRMLVDKTLVQLINEMKGQLMIEPHGAALIELLRKCYTEGKNIQTATFELVNALFGSYGLIVLIPDSADFKRTMIPVFEDDLFRQTPSAIVAETSKKLEQHYYVQAHPRDINLFYFKDNIRERIIKTGDRFLVNNTDIHFTEESLRQELQQHPERFSPNVILRGLFQETILPNLAFIGGGGELGYWLQLKALFHHYNVVFPVLLLRNSFLIIEKKWQQLVDKLQLTTEQIFQPPLQLLDLIIEREGKTPRLDGELSKVKALYEQINETASNIDVTLAQHVTALQVKALKQLQNLEKKMNRAERKKHEAEENQVNKLKNHLFPNNGLQERVENFSSFYAKWGSGFIDALYENSLSLEQEFVVLNEMEN